MKKIILFLFFLSFFGCTPNKVDVKITESGDTIRNVENRLNRSVGDTCIVERKWFSYFEDTYQREQFRLVTKVESEQRLKTEFTWLHKGESREKLVEGVSYKQGVVIAKY